MSDLLSFQMAAPGTNQLLQNLPIDPITPFCYHLHFQGCGVGGDCLHDHPVDHVVIFPWILNAFDS